MHPDKYTPTLSLPTAAVVLMAQEPPPHESPAEYTDRIKQMGRAAEAPAGVERKGWLREQGVPDSWLMPRFSSAQPTPNRQDEPGQGRTQTRQANRDKCARQIEARLSVR